MALSGGDLVNNPSVGAPHPKPLTLKAKSREVVHGDLAANSQVGPPRPDPVSITLPDGVDLATWYGTVKAYIAAHP